MLLRAAACSAASSRAAGAGSSRLAAVASIVGGAAALLPQNPPVASPLPLRRCLSSRMPPSQPGRVNFVVKDEDLESDEALWALYERWCKAFGAERSLEEMHRYFDEFKDCVFHVDSFNKRAIRDGKSSRLEVNKFADRKLAEQLFNDVPIEVLDRVPYSQSPIIGRAGHRIVNKKGSGLWGRG